MADGCLSMVLHAHLPFVRHPEHQEFLEEDWFFSACIETYIPLLAAYQRLLEEGVDFRITMSVTPPLCEMMADSLLQQRFKRHLNNLISLMEREKTGEVGVAKLKDFYHKRYLQVQDIYLNKWNGNLLNGFNFFQQQGVLEIITCGATHGFLPLMITEEAVRAQIAVAVNNYRKHFGVSPRGIWLPECAYYPGLEAILKENGIQYFILDSHGLLNGSPTPHHGIFSPVFCPNGVVALGRDIESSRQVWSAEIGYPGDIDYREFYRDLGYDADYDYISPYLHRDGIRRSLGVKYHRVTGQVELHQKQLYDPPTAREKAASHAGNFLFNRQHQIKHLRGLMGRQPLVISPYDAELFGHWWFEGPDFIEYLFRKIHYDQDELELITPSQFIERNPVNQVSQPAMSSWGANGYYEVWLNGSNDWIYRHLHVCEERMVALTNKYPQATGLQRRALNQAARELLLAQSSDWAFIMTTGTCVPYAHKRTKVHLLNFNGLYLQIEQNRLEEDWIAHLEWQNNIFSEIDYRVYCAKTS